MYGLANISKVIMYITSMELTLEEFFVLLMLKTNDYGNLYRYAHEAVKIDTISESFRCLEEKGFIKQNPFYLKDRDSIVDKYEFIDNSLDELLLDSESATKELIECYPKTIKIQGVYTPARNISFDDLHDIYVKKVGYTSKQLTQEYKDRVIAKKFNKKLQIKLEDVNLGFVDKESHYKIIEKTKLYSVLIEQGKMSPMGLDKYAKTEAWDSIDTIKEDFTHIQDV